MVHALPCAFEELIVDPKDLEEFVRDLLKHVERGSGAMKGHVSTGERPLEGLASSRSRPT